MVIPELIIRKKSGATTMAGIHKTGFCVIYLHSASEIWGRLGRFRTFDWASVAENMRLIGSLLVA